MKTLIIIIALAVTAAVAFTGCASVNGKRTDKDGNTLAINSTRFLWTTEGLDAKVTDENGFTFELSAKKDSADAQAITASFNGLGDVLSKLAPFLLAGQNGTNAPVTTNGLTLHKASRRMVRHTHQ